MQLCQERVMKRLKESADKLSKVTTMEKDLEVRQPKRYTIVLTADVVHG
jgi:hypothetical protein